MISLKWTEENKSKRKRKKAYRKTHTIIWLRMQLLQLQGAEVTRNALILCSLPLPPPHPPSHLHLGLQSLPSRIQCRRTPRPSKGRGLPRAPHEWWPPCLGLTLHLLSCQETLGHSQAQCLTCLQGGPGGGWLPPVLTI